MCRTYTLNFLCFLTRIWSTPKESTLYPFPAFKILDNAYSLDSNTYRQDANVYIPQPVSVEHTGRPGHPRKHVDLAILKEATKPGRQIPTVTLSNILGIHRNTLCTIIKDNGIDTGFSNISDQELDKIVCDYQKDHPSAGRGYIAGHLRSAHNLRVPRKRISDSVNRVDRLGQGMKRK